MMLNKILLLQDNIINIYEYFIINLFIEEIAKVNPREEIYNF